MVKKDLTGWHTISSSIARYYSARHWCWQHISRDDWSYNADLKKFYFKNSDDAIMFRLKYEV